MHLELKNIFSGTVNRLPFSYEMDLSDVEVNGVYPFVSPISVKGEAVSRIGGIQLAAKVEFDFSMPCDRCMEPIHKRVSYSFSHILVANLEDSEKEEEEYIQVEGDRLDLDELIRADILLELPIKYLCREDCKGLCPSCGENLNHGSCDCNLHQVDPRLEVLRKLID